MGGTELTRYNHHAYSHVNALSSAAMTYAVTGDPEYLQVIVNVYEWLEKTQLYAIGGYGPDERLMPPDGSLRGRWLRRSGVLKPRAARGRVSSWPAF